MIRKTLGAATTVAALIVVIGVFPTSAYAHGTMSDPPSRVHVCRFADNPENPQLAACRAAIAASGTQAFYDWNEVSLIDAAGQHQARIPDGQLCSAGREKYRGLDLPRSDWPATPVSPGRRLVTYYATAPHAHGEFSFFLTRAGWSPTEPLRWSDLVPLESFPDQNPTTYTSWDITLPERTGRHVLYTIWQRSAGSDEAFYACSDVDFGGSGAQPPPQPLLTATAAGANGAGVNGAGTGPGGGPTGQGPTGQGPTGQGPTGQGPTGQGPTGQEPTVPGPTAPQVIDAGQAPGSVWRPYVHYRLGSRVTFNGKTFVCHQAHVTLPGWEPPFVAALWSGSVQ